ncbi:MAG: CBS domain-containing protein [Candidatus Korarchaeum sp.]|nr:CBS domain-containing protein [Candidatus Korarchaeum sp.]MDW8036076.1 CBS domain-containing protein [Candidatus Korarchaeum sp.]
MRVKVNEYMTRDVAFVLPSDTLGKARNLMLERRVRRLVVVEEGRVVGVITATDITKALAKRGAPWRWRDPENALVGRFMTRDPITIGPEESVPSAARVMVERAIGGLPVVRDSELVGILSETDVTKFFEENMRGSYRAGDLLSERYGVVRHDTNIKKVARIITSGQRVVLVSGPDGRYEGIISEGELALWVPELSKRYVLIPSRVGRRVILDTKVKIASSIMKELRIKVTPEDDASKAARFILEWGLPAVPVFDREKLLGVVDKKAIVRGVSHVS